MTRMDVCVRVVDNSAGDDSLFAVVVVMNVMDGLVAVLAHDNHALACGSDDLLVLSIIVDSLDNSCFATMMPVV